MCKRGISLVGAILLCATLTAQREVLRLDEGWQFHFGHATDVAKDYGCGTEYFNYLTKAASLHNEGPYSPSFDDSTWQTVRLPHDWVTTLPYDSLASHSHGYKTVGYRYPATSVGWYRRTFFVPADALGKHIVVQFDGIYRAAQVWCNGIFMGSEPSGYAEQVYDITDYVTYGGDNVLCVRADATLEEGWYYEGAGIYRDVWLTYEDPLHVAHNGTFVSASFNANYAVATISIATTVENSGLSSAAYTLRTTLVDDDGQMVVSSAEDEETVCAPQECTAHTTVLTVDNPHLWSPSDPYLYTAISEIIDNKGDVIDTYTTRTGLREVVFTADEGLFLNGESIKIQGVNMHQDHAGVGTALPDALLRWRIKRLKALGVNTYRSSHHPVSPALLAICDEEGMFVIEENRLIGSNAYHRRLLENFILRDRNHPCILLWSLGNEEWGVENSVTGTRIAQTMTAIAKTLDPTRRSTIANAGGDELIKGLDIVGYNYIIQNAVLARREEHPEWTIIGTEETTGTGTRGVYFNTPGMAAAGQMAALNRIPLDSTGQVDCAPAAGSHTPASGTQGIERGWTFYHNTPWAAGCCFWTGFDYRGEPNPLHYPAHDSQFGILDYCGNYKDEAYYLRAAWTEKPMVHLLPSWTLRGHDGEEIDVWAYSNCEEVALTINGTDYGRQHMPRDGHATWKVSYTPGTAVVTGYNGGTVVATETTTTAGEATQIRATADRDTLVADGRDVAIIEVVLCDDKGNIVPDACHDITFTLTGEGRIIGAGNGDPACLCPDHPSSPDCQTFAFPAFNGYAQLLVQTTTTPGPLTLTIAAPSLTPAALPLSSLLP